MTKEGKTDINLVEGSPDQDLQKGENEKTYIERTTEEISDLSKRIKESLEERKNNNYFNFISGEQISFLSSEDNNVPKNLVENLTNAFESFGTGSEQTEDMTDDPNSLSKLSEDLEELERLLGQLGYALKLKNQLEEHKDNIANLREKVLKAKEEVDFKEEHRPQGVSN